MASVLISAVSAATANFEQLAKADKFYRLREEKLQREKELAAQLRAVQKQERSARQNLRDSSRKSAENAR